MKITRQKLRRLISEEIRRAIVERKKKKSGPIARLAKDVEKRGTEGDFSKWCGPDGVTQACINRAVKAGGKRAQQANLAVTFSKSKGGQKSLTYPKKKG